jgi:hypothetical protein
MKKGTKTTDPSKFPPYACKRHGPVKAIVRLRGGYYHRRCSVCLRDYLRVYMVKWNRRVRVTARQAVLREYGGKCVCCSESNFGFLTIDHVRYDEPSHRGRNRRYDGPGTIYSWLASHGMPKDGYRIMCYNCNLGRDRNGGVCPHASGS